MTPTSLTAGLSLLVLLVAPTALAGDAGVSPPTIIPGRLAEEDDVVCVRQEENPEIYVFTNCGDEVYVKVGPIEITISLPSCSDFDRFCVKYRRP